MTSKDLNSHDGDAKKRAAALREATVEALLDERRQNERNADRVKSIDAALKDAGYKAPSGRKAAPKDET